MKRNNKISTNTITPYRLLGALLLLLLLSNNNLFAQQDAQFTQYMFNPLVLNPAYAGSREGISGNMLYRDQWTAFEGAPVTQTFGIHAPLRNNKVGLGFHVINDQIGPVGTTGINGSYAYRLKMGKGKLALGLRAGIFNYRFDWNKVEYKDKTDIFSGVLPTRRFMPTFDFGTYYYTSKLYFGVAVSHLDQATYAKTVTDGNYKIKLASHFVATAGYAVVINKKVTLKPSVVVKTLTNQIPTVDFNAAILLDEKLWLGVGVRSTNSAMIIAEYNLSRNFRFGYSYDMSINEMQSVNKGSHEVFLGFDFDIYKTKTLSPRYF